MQVAGRLELVKQAPISLRRLRCHLKRRNALSNHLKSELHQVAGGFFSSSATECAQMTLRNVSHLLICSAVPH